MKKVLSLILCIILLYAGSLSAQTIKIGVDSNMWYPYTYAENINAKGLHVDIVTLALKNLGYTYVINVYPWKRCLVYAEKGTIDGIISASYKKERAEYMNYPPKSDIHGKADFRITHVQYSIVSLINNPYDYDGNMKSLPQPVLVPLGYSIGDDIKKEGIPIMETPGDIKNFLILSLRKGCLITLPGTAHLMMQRPEYKGKFYLSKTPLKSKSYFFPFSKKSAIPDTVKMKVWKEIKKIRKDKKRMDLFLKKY